MLGPWDDPGSWTTEQWLAAVIMGFIILSILVMLHRLLLEEVLDFGIYLADDLVCWRTGNGQKDCR